MSADLKTKARKLLKILKDDYKIKQVDIEKKCKYNTNYISQALSRTPFTNERLYSNIESIYNYVIVGGNIKDWVVVADITPTSLSHYQDLIKEKDRIIKDLRDQIDMKNKYISELEIKLNMKSNAKSARRA